MMHDKKMGSLTFGFETSLLAAGSSMYSVNRSIKVTKRSVLAVHLDHSTSKGNSNMFIYLNVYMIHAQQ